MNVDYYFDLNRSFLFPFCTLYLHTHTQIYADDIINVVVRSLE